VDSKKDVDTTVDLKKTKADVGEKVGHSKTNTEKAKAPIGNKTAEVMK
jgi:hypothetical protein